MSLPIVEIKDLSLKYGNFLEGTCTFCPDFGFQLIKELLFRTVNRQKPLISTFSPPAKAAMMLEMIASRASEASFFFKVVRL